MNKQAWLGVFRHALTTLGGILVASGVIDESTATAATGAIVTLAGIVLSVWNKKGQ